MDNLEITPAEVKKMLDARDAFLLVDCRDPWEFQSCRIEGAQLIPMGTIPAHLQELDAAEKLVVFCHHGCRSLDVVAWLLRQGVEGARSMAGGIERWSCEIDPNVPRY